MNESDLIKIISAGESSTVQFKERLPHSDSLANEMIAFSNSRGGIIIFGVEDKSGSINGLSFDEVRQINQQAVNIASQKIYPPIFLTSENISINDNNLVVLTINEGISKPYKNSSGTIYVKNGSDKRKVTSNDEIARLLKTHSFLADETEILGSGIKNVNETLFSEYFEKEFGMTYKEKGLTYEQALYAKKIMRNGSLTLAGLLFFNTSPQSFRPAFTVKAVLFNGNDIGSDNYRSKPEDLTGPLPELFRQAMLYVKSCIKHLQNGRGFNTIGTPEISIIALEEVIQNALIHRDYFKNSPVRLMIFDNRVEIISPGCLPNSLTVEDVKYGNPVIRNNQIVMFASRTMPYSGLGSGLRRAFAAQPDLELINDINDEQFIAKFPRK